MTRTGITAVLATYPSTAVRATRHGPDRVVITGPGIRLVLTRAQADALGFDLIHPQKGSR